MATGLRPAPRAGKACLGFSGSITWVNPDGADERVVTGLPSIASELEALGPMDLIVRDNGHYIASIGIGGDDACVTSTARRASTSAPW